MRTGLNRAILGLVATALLPMARAAEEETIVELPPMMIETTSSKVKWYYVKVGRDEYLSRCSADVTEQFIESNQNAVHRLRALIPETFLAEIPMITVLYDQALQPKADDAVAKSILERPAPAAEKVTKARRGVLSARFLPNLRVDDRDLTVAFAYVDANEVGDTHIRVPVNYARLLLERRTPMLPPWLVEGLLGVQEQVQPSGHGVIAMPPMVWLPEEPGKSGGINPARPRALLSTEEMFAGDALRGEGKQSPMRAKTLQFQVALFIRWGLDRRNNVRDAFWAFAQRASEGKVTEEMFTACFGFGYADLRDRLNDYVSVALKAPLFLELGPPPPETPTKIREADPTEIARLRGEWERLEASYVQKTNPAYIASYREQAKRTLERAYAQGDRDAGLIAALGLFKAEAGETKAALPLLEAAMAAGAMRPRVYAEVARIRFGDLLRDQPAGKVFTPTELAPVLDPLRRMLALTPPLPETYGVMADAWLRSNAPPPAEDLATLVKGAHAFALHPTVAYRVALALAKYGRRAEAVTLLNQGVDGVGDDLLRTRYNRVLEALTGETK